MPLEGISMRSTNPTRRLTLLLATLSLAALGACSSMGDKMAMMGMHNSGVALSGAQEVPAVMTSASGMAMITVAADGAVSGNIKTSGVMGPMAHIHMGAMGANGGVIVPLTKTDDSTWSVPAGAKLTPEQVAAYQAGGLYVNVHSADHKGGEIRAQLKP
jgi:hypothetical protein